MNEGRVGRATRTGHSPEWLFVVGHAFIAAVPAAANSTVVGELAALATAAQVDLESVVSVIPLGGDSAVESFVVVVPEGDLAGTHDGDHDGIAVSVVIRGEIAADIYSVGGSRRFTDRGIRPWLLADFRSVVGVVLGSPSYTAVAPGDLRGGEPLGVGTAHGDSLFWSSTPPDVQSEPQAAQPQQRDEPEKQREQPDSLEKKVAPAQDVQAHDMPAHDIHAHDMNAEDVDDTILRPRAARDDTILRPRARVDDTVIRPLAGSRDAGTEESGPHHDDPVNGDTVLRPPLGTSPADRATQPIEPIPAAAPRYGFRVSGGEERRLDAVYYLGRRPVAPRVPTDRVPLLLTVDSRTSAVSSTHLEIRQVGDAVVVTDLGSTNGTVIRWPRGKQERLRGGQSLAVLPGTTVDIGDGNIIEILPVSGR